MGHFFWDALYIFLILELVTFEHLLFERVYDEFNLNINVDSRASNLLAGSVAWQPHWLCWLVGEIVIHTTIMPLLRKLFSTLTNSSDLITYIKRVSIS